MNQLPLFPLFDPDVGNPIVDLSGPAIRLGDRSDSVSGGNGGQVAVNPDVAVKGTEIVSDTAIQCGLPDSLLFLKGGGFLQEIRVKRTRLSYKDPGSGLITRVMFPAKIRTFVRLYDAGYIPELREN